MYRNKTFSVIVPCRNEPKGIKKLMELMPKFIDEVVVIDSSDDDTAEIARKMGAKVIIEPRRGYGLAYKTGFENGASEYFITMDADCTYPVKDEELKKLLDIVLDENLEFVTAARFPLKFDPGVMPPVRIIGNTLITLTGNLLFQTNMRDYLSGMWIFRKEVLKKFYLECDGWSLSEEIKLEALINKVRFKEIHIPYHARVGKATLVDFAFTQYKVGLINTLYFFKKRFFRKLKLPYTNI